MPRQITTPPAEPPAPDGGKSGGWWHESDDPERIVCDLCPRHCVLRPGDRGFCFVRQNRNGQVVSTTYGRSTGFCIDPIEKKPLYQFYPNTAVLSFGTPGCNLGCNFCQNWTMSRSKDVEAACQSALPETIARAALQLGCKSVAFTYNDPIIWAEYAIDTARACRAAGIKTVAVTSGYISELARPAFFEFMDAANVDLKGYTEDFYRQYCAGRLQPVLDTLEWLAKETSVWVEITNLVIPQANDNPDEIKRMCEWIVEKLGPDVPLHFSAFHPDFKLTDRGATPLATLQTAHDLAKQAGIHYVYLGNILSANHQNTFCPGCGRAVIERDGYQMRSYAIQAEEKGTGPICAQHPPGRSGKLDLSPFLHGRCRFCQVPLAGRYDPAPGNWGPRRQPVDIRRYAQ